jgi:hypothetical protein
MVAHDVLTCLCAKELGLENRSVEITPYTYSDPGPYNPESEIEYREGGRPTVRSDDAHIDEERFYAPFVSYDPPASRQVSALDVISLYSAEPDWGMDDKLYLSVLQRLTGDSLGYRHLRFGLFWFRAGIAHRRAVHFTELARAAFEKDDPYWGIRFSARAIHYIEDLLTPLHTKPFPEWFFLRMIISLKRRDIPQIAFNYHHSFERYTGYYLWHGDRGYISAIEQAPLAGFSNPKKDLRKGWRASRRIFYPLFREWRKVIGMRAERGSVLLSPEDAARTGHPVKLRQCVERWLGLASGYVKGYISVYVAPYLEDLCK